MPTNRLIPAIGALAAALALGACGSGSGSAPPDYAAALRDAPPKLAALYRQGNEVLPGGQSAFDRRLRQLRGTPVVVTAWASWCGPCRVEFPFFQRQSAAVGSRVAFVGVDVDDNTAAARTFLGEYPVPFPSYSDPDKSIFRAIAPAAPGPPATVFYDAAGREAYAHVGQYPTEDALAADIRRYAGQQGRRAGG